MSRPVEGCDERPALAGVRKVNLHDPRADCPDTHCNFGCTLQFRRSAAQDIQIDVRKALRRLTPFLDGKWELVNGFPGRTDDPYSPFSGGPDIVPTRDSKWIMLAEIYPALRQHALDLLKPRGGSYEAVRDA